MQKNSPIGKKRSPGSSALKTKLKIHPSMRVHEFPGEELTVFFGTLYCTACQEHLSVKRSRTKNHVSSQKHGHSMTKLKHTLLPSSIEKYDQSVHPKRESLKIEQRAYRVNVLKPFMRTGVHLKFSQAYQILILIYLYK